MVLSPLAVAVIAEQEEEAAPAAAPLTAALLGTLDLVTSAEPAPGAQLLWLGDPGKVLTVLTELLTRPRYVQIVLQKVASELHPKVRNHGEGPY